MLKLLREDQLGRTCLHRVVQAQQPVFIIVCISGALHKRVLALAEVELDLSEFKVSLVECDIDLALVLDHAHLNLDVVA